MYVIKKNWKKRVGQNNTRITLHASSDRILCKLNLKSFDVRYVFAYVGICIFRREKFKIQMIKTDVYVTANFLGRYLRSLNKNVPISFESVDIFYNIDE